MQTQDPTTDNWPLPPTKKLTAAYPWIVLALAGAVMPLVFLAAAAAMAGTPVIGAYLRTVYWHYPLVVAALCLAASGACIWIASTGWRRRTMPPLWARLLPAAIILVSIAFLVQIIRWQDFRSRGVQPSTAARFAHRAGPWVQFIPGGAGEADAATALAIWYYDPQPRRDSRILYGTDARRESMSELLEIPGGDGRRHEFRIYGLRPGTTYRYRIPALDDTVRSFTTAPAAGTAFRFVTLGDTGNTGEGGSAPSYYGEVQDAADRWYAAQGARPAFKVHLGDLVRTGIDLPAWRTFFESERHAAALPVIMTPGNHEFLRDDGANWSYFFTQPRYGSYDIGNAHILVLNAFDGPGTSLDGPVVTSGRAQYEFARQDLARVSGTRWIIVVLHIPVMSTGDYNMNALLAAQYRELFRRYGVDLVLSGHDHNFDAFHADRESDWGGTLYVVCGTGGSSLDGYIMDRPKKQWKSWRHDRDSAEGLYLDDAYTRRYHVYGELSWGFADIAITNDRLTLTYCRWLSLPDFLAATNQASRAWRMVPLPAAVRDRMPVPVVRLEKMRVFNSSSSR